MFYTHIVYIHITNQRFRTCFFRSVSDDSDDRENILEFGSALLCWHYFPRAHLDSPPPSSCNKRYPFSLQCWFKRFSRIIKRLMYYYSLVWLLKGSPGNSFDEICAFPTNVVLNDQTQRQFVTVFSIKNIIMTLLVGVWGVFFMQETSSVRERFHEEMYRNCLLSDGDTIPGYPWRCKDKRQNIID